MKSKKRHHDSSEESEDSEVSEKSSSSSSESDSSASEHRHKKKKKRAESSDSESDSDDQKRAKKRKHKKKKKKHTKKKRRSVSVEDITDDNISISDGEISSKKKRKHKHKHSKRGRSSSPQYEGDVRPMERRLHSVVKERHPSPGESQHKKSYYQYAPPPEKYEGSRERYDQDVQYQHTSDPYEARPKEYPPDYKRPQRYEEVEYHRKPRDDNYHREDPKARYNAHEERGFNKKREFVDNREYRDRRPPPEPERYREKEFPDRRERLPEERYPPERSRDVRRERPPRVEKSPLPSHRISKSRSPDDRYREKRREDKDRAERRERVDRSRNEKEDRPERAREPREERDKRLPAGRSRERRSRFDNADEKKEYSWGKTEVKKEGDNKDGEKEKPNFGLSGKLTADANTVNGVVIKYTEPDDAKQPKRRWRFYPFKGDKALPILYIHRQSCFVIGRDKKVVDIALDHPSISKQHAALQYRATPFDRPDGTQGRRVRPYIIDLDSANGTFVNNKKIDPRRYVELLERDVVKFGFSAREYVLLHENSRDDAQDDDQPALPTTDHIKQVKRVKEEEAADG
ncbi:smad nuclear interacting protein 1-like isoform X2 [Aricia agestis]|uniref:smad nuclear interacting protein 1-like isoform X2 n=1 Tax=Aricia agestis TaxID=91739 RepID=UPI001C2022F6|nr:smad nuclear interacting protein 1-like isoform X2 [Aricia agestis]